jgi:hypothetical protein
MSAKYCLKIQGKTASKVFPCKICKIEFSTKLIFQRHTSTHDDFDRETCKINIALKAENDNLKNEFKIEVENLKNQLSYSQDIIFKQDNQIRELTRTIERIASRPVNVTSTNILNINTFQPITPEFLIQESPKLTKEDIGDRDGIGYAIFAENIFKDKIACTDYARGILKWKNEKDIVNDPKGEKIWRLFCTTLCPYNEELYKEVARSIQIDEGDQEELMNKIVAYTENLSAVQGGKRGESSDLQRVVIEHLCRIFKR